MKLAFFLVILLLTHITNGQNVGVGTNTPVERLDVNGNINLTGSIKVNGVDGQPNQVLMKNSNGVLGWTDIAANYKNFRVFDFTSAGANQNWNVPAGVITLFVEMWGGGGGGSPNGGGGGGGYGIVVYTVALGSAVSILVGGGGTGSTGVSGMGTAGTRSQVIAAGNLYAVNGGAGAGNYPGYGGGPYQYSTGFPYVFYNGQTGRKNQESYQQSSATDFLLLTKFGSGGVSYTEPQIGGEGGFTFTNAANGNLVREVFGARGYGVGEGGGGGRSYGYPGAAGRVTIRW